MEAVDGLKARLARLAPGLVRPAEPLKLVLDANALGRSGRALADLLRAHKVECEYADGQYVVLMFAPGNRPLDYERVEQGMKAAAQAPAEGAFRRNTPDPGLWVRLEEQARPQCTIRQAVFARQDLVPVEQAVGRVCALPTVACPPAIPIAVSGETIGPAAAELFGCYGIRRVAVTTE